MLKTRVFLQRNIDLLHVVEQFHALESRVVLVDQPKVLLDLADAVFASVHNLH